MRAALIKLSSVKFFRFQMEIKNKMKKSNMLQVSGSKLIKEEGLGSTNVSLFYLLCITSTGVWLRVPEKCNLTGPYTKKTNTSHDSQFYRSAVETENVTLFLCI